ncbi:MAG TPA: hypothetical protein VFD46_10070 [Chryseolinea sp.]|nr:hypothetical protein [Chryseolinea sp.]
MNKSLKLGLGLLCFIGFASGWPLRGQALIYKKATRETQALYTNLKKISQQGLLFGHQDDDAYGTKWKAILQDPSKVICRPGGHFISPENDERVGDVSNVTFSNGWVELKNGQVLIYYGSSNTRMHVATSSIDQLVDYCLNTPDDNFRSAASVASRNELISNNFKVLEKLKLR